VRFLPAHVTTMEGFRPPGRPLRFSFEGGDMEVSSVHAHWYEAYTDATFHPDEYYVVEAQDAAIYLLRYSTLFRSWWVRRDTEVAP